MEKTAEDKGSTCKACKTAFCQCMQAVKAWADKYLLHVFAIALALSVFVVGFFTTFKFKPMEQVQAKISLDVSSGAGINDITTLLFAATDYNQNMLNPLWALDMDLSEQMLSEESSKITEQIAAVMGKDMLNNRDEFLELVSLLTTAGSSSEQAAVLAKLLAFVQDTMEGSSAMANINLIRLDRLEAELAYLQASADSDSWQLKVADDTLTRTILLSVASGVYVYLQVIALVMVILSALRFLKGKKQKGDMLLAYFIGFAVLMILCELTAVTLNGAGIACFVLVAVFAGLSWLYRAVTEKTMQPAVAATRAVSVSLVFAAFCVFFGELYDFGVAVSRIGALFGLHGYDSPLIERESLGSLTENLIFIGVPHLICMALVAASVIFLLRAGEKQSAFGWILPFVSFVVVLLTYILLNVFAGDKLELISVSVAMLTISVLCLLATVFCLAEKFFRRAGTQQEVAASESVVTE